MELGILGPLGLGIPGSFSFATLWDRERRSMNLGLRIEGIDLPFGIAVLRQSLAVH